MRVFLSKLTVVAALCCVITSGIANESDVDWKDFSIIGKWEGWEGNDYTWLYFYKDGSFKLRKYQNKEPVFVSNDEQSVKYRIDTSKSPAWFDIVIRMKDKRKAQMLKDNGHSPVMRLKGIIKIVDQNTIVVHINSNPMIGKRPRDFEGDGDGLVALSRVINPSDY